MSKDASEQFWLGEQRTRGEDVVMRMQNEVEEKAWLATLGGTALDPSYSEYSIRLYDPNIRSLSFIHRTLAILPKSRLLAIFNLIGEYLDNTEN
jgi:hypothetical protein